jgi:hypothetical protein
LSPANGPLGNNRPNYSYLSAAGGVIEDGIVIESRSAATLRLKVYAADAYTTPDGLLDLAPAAEPPSDAGAWISFGAPVAGAEWAPEASSAAGGGETATGAEAWPGQASVEVTIEPSGAVTVPLRWAVPADAAPGDHAAGIVTSLIEDASAGAVQVDRRLALRAYVNVSGELTPGLTISDLRVEAEPSANPFASGTITVSYRLTNTGSARLVATERIAVAGPFGWGGRDGGAGEVLPEILPGSFLSRQVTVAGVFPLFRTTATVMADAVAVGLGAEGAPASAERAATVWTVPWLWLGLALVALSGAVWLPVRRARRAASADGGKTGLTEAPPAP